MQPQLTVTLKGRPGKGNKTRSPGSSCFLVGPWQVPAAASCHLPVTGRPLSYSLFNASCASQPECCSFPWGLLHGTAADAYLRPRHIIATISSFLFSAHRIQANWPCGFLRDPALLHARLSHLCAMSHFSQASSSNLSFPAIPSGLPFTVE